MPEPPTAAPQDPTAHFHPAVAAWFRGAFPGPTEVQCQAWPAIQARRHTLIAAPTGSGKTLSAFMAVINDLTERALTGDLPDQTLVVYISPLKALSNDIQKNLAEPLAGIDEALIARGETGAALRTAVRTGDTPPAERQKMVKNPPHILVTTPESLYLLLTSKGGRQMLGQVETVIIDEIHAMIDDKRGSHLSLSLERLTHLTGRPPVRIGLSATQKPIETVAEFLVGVPENPAERDCTIIDAGHQRTLDLAIEVPGSPLTAVMEAEVWSEVYDRMCSLVETHETTLIFVNTRRLAERLAHQLGERLGEAHVSSHHGSMSKEKRFLAEQQLKQGKLKALVATASLELGIDIGSVDLVLQISSPKSIAAFLQRVGRAGHSVGGTPKGRLFPVTRDDLVECCAILDAVRRGELDALVVPDKPLDILAQQIVAEVAGEDWDEQALFDLCRRSYAYRNLSRQEFDEIVTMLAEGFTLRRGRRSAYLHHDVVNGQLRPRRGARITALTCGGAIPDTFEFDVVLEPADIKVGTLDEDFALESMPGDIFQLGNSSWMILKVDGGKVRVADAGGQPPTIPFWLGEGPGRSDELSQAVARLRHEVCERLRFDTDGGTTINGDRALAWLSDEVGIDPVAGQQVIDYLGTSRLALGAIPTQQTIITERFFDEAGDMHVVVHAPFGSRMNRAWGLALRKRFCKTFNFELQAAANEDALILSLGSTHSFPVAEVYQFLQSASVRDVLIQALLDAPMFEIRWRWNASRALAILRNRMGKRMPPQLQRMDAEDLLALVFPDSLACLETIVGERELPDHPLVNQTLEDCLTEAMDIEAMEAFLRRKEAGEVELIARDLREPSPMAQEIINAKPYAFLDPAPLEERRTNAIKNRRWLDPAEAAQLASLDAAAVERVRQEAWPDGLRDLDEMHDAVVLLGFLTEHEVTTRGEADWPGWLEALAANGRASRVALGAHTIWVGAERLLEVQAAFGLAASLPALRNLPPRLRQREWSEQDARRELVRSRLEGLGPVTVAELAAGFGWAPEQLAAPLAALEGEGFAFQGRYTPDVAEIEWCERRLLARIHKYTVNRLRAEIEPVAVADYMRFLFQWQGVTEGEQRQGLAGVQGVCEQLQAFEAPAVAWESDILPLRVASYDPAWLDQTCLSGRLVWGRLTHPRQGEEARNASGPIRSSPLALVVRDDLPDWQLLGSGGGRYTLSSNATRVVATLSDHGALFFDDIVRHSGLLGTQLESALAEVVGAGLVTADSFMGMRALLTPQQLRPTSGPRRRRGRRAPQGMAHAGRWSLLPTVDGEGVDAEAVSGAVEAFAWTLLRRYGVVFRKMLARERLAPPWRELVRVLRLWEARGEIRGGYFVTGVSGEQFALPETVATLRAIRRQSGAGQLVALSAADPLNFCGILTPDERISALAGNRVLYQDGEAVAVLEAGTVRRLKPTPGLDDWQLKARLERLPTPPKLRAYLGR